MVNHKVNHKTIELINSLKNKEKIKILFVCLGNICRSAAAHGIFETIADGDTEFEVESAGLYHGHRGELPDNRMRCHASKRGYELTHRARPFMSADFADYDMIIGMDGSNIVQLHRLAPTFADEQKIVAMIDFVNEKQGYDYVPDPYYEGAEGFELVLDLLEDGCLNLYKKLKGGKR